MNGGNNDIYSRVFVIGAGFSKPAGIPLASELTDDLICTATNNGHLEELAKSIALVRSCLGENNDTTNIEMLLEACFTLCELHAAQKWVPFSGSWLEQRNVDWARMVGRLLDAVADVIWQYQAHTTDTSYLDDFVRQLTPHDVIVSFNYDTLVEDALRRNAMEWTHTLHDGTQPGRTRVLKMHGSIDWFLLERDVQFEVSTTLLWPPDDNTPNKLIRLNDKLGHALGVRRMNGWKSALAPLGGRKPISQIPGVGMIWGCAGEHIRLCDEIIVVGFSFSPFDLMIRLLMGSESRQRSKAPRMCVIDPYPEVPARRLSALMSGEPVRACPASACEVAWNCLPEWIDTH